MDLDRVEILLPGAITRLSKWVLDASEEDMELILRALEIQVQTSSNEFTSKEYCPLRCLKRKIWSPLYKHRDVCFSVLINPGCSAS